ncbi:MAG: phospho-N-acetylmuramoyl-pentapeptide-transferase [Clostridia bacterium]
MFKQYLIAGLIGFLLSLFSMGIILPILKKMKAKQEILSYVKLHAKKSGTATMGGLSFLFAFFIGSVLLIKKEYSLSIFTLVITFAYAVVGFLDDYIKVRYKRNLGLTAIQKLIVQLAIATIASIYVYTNSYIGTIINIPFTSIEFDIKFFIIPLTILSFLGGTNGVNLTDGLDGLASSVTITVTSVMCVLTMFSAVDAENCGMTQLSVEYINMATINAIMAGSLAAFLIFNCNTALVFMGDTGSMALGAFVVCSCVFTKNTLLIIVLGVMYVISALSSMLQVVYFKLTKGKRLFLMAPLHHHLQMKGLSETRVDVIYTSITVVIGILLIISKL